MANPNEATRKAEDKIENKATEVSGNVQGKAADAKDKVSETASSAGETIQKAKEATQNFIGDKAGQIGTLAQQTYDKASDKAAQLGNRAADAISSSADYVKNIDMEKARKVVKDKPELSIMIAALTGLVIGLVIGRSRKD